MIVQTHVSMVGVIGVLLFGLLLFVGLLLIILFFTLRKPRPPAPAPAGEHSPWLPTFLVAVGVLLFSFFLVFFLRSRRAIDSQWELHLEDPAKSWQALDALAGETPLTPAKSWVNNAGGSLRFSFNSPDVSIVARKPGSPGYLVGYSRQWETTPEEALRSARDSVKRQLTAVVLWKLFEEKGRQAPLRREQLDFGKLRELIGARVEPKIDTLAEDRYQEEAKRAYGTVHRAALLVRVRPETLASLSQQAREDLQVAKETEVTDRYRDLWTLLGAAGLALVVFLLYCFLNAGTKGYFAWPLRILSLGTLVLLFLGLGYLRGWLP